MADKRHLAVRFDDEAWSEDLSHATPGGREEAERDRPRWKPRGSASPS
jgi:hypothetical protein